MPLRRILYPVVLLAVGVFALRPLWIGSWPASGISLDSQNTTDDMRRHGPFVDCGAYCLYVVCRAEDIAVSVATVRELAKTDRIGTSLANLKVAAEEFGFTCRAVHMDRTRLQKHVCEDASYAILHVNNNHFVVVARLVTGRDVVIVDPARGVFTLSFPDLMKEYRWQGNALLLNSSPQLEARHES